MLQPRRLLVYLTFLGLVLFFMTAFLLHTRDEPPPVGAAKKPESQIPTGPKYKPKPAAKPLQIVDNFPLAAAAYSASELPPIPRWSAPPATHAPERTPLFIGFIRNWRLLQQVVVSYITSGWPASDIYVVENTGVLDANKLGQLSLQNPFFLNHTRLDMLGVNVIIAPTLFTFAQLQNFYLYTSTMEKYSYYFWSHMDVVAVPFEWEYGEKHPDQNLTTPTADYSGFSSIYSKCLSTLREVLKAQDSPTAPLRWAMRFFSYDRLALVNVAAFRSIGGWDTMIPFYMTDCDMHARLEMAGFNIEERPAGLVYDVASSLDDLLVLYRKIITPNGTKIPDASFLDPNIRAEELAKAAKEEEEARKNPPPRKLEQEQAPVEKKPPARRAQDASSVAFEAAAALLPTGPSTHLAPASKEDILNSPSFKILTTTLDHMQNSKQAGSTRNSWQARQTGGQGDPFYRDSVGFEEAILMTIEFGRQVFREKWGHRDCDIVRMGLKPEDAWRVEHDW
jgi:hypothetical protein